MAGWARSESVLPVLCSGFFWEGGCADSNFREVSSDSYFFLFLEALSAVLVVLYCCFAVVDYLIKRCHNARYLAAKNGTNNGDLIR